MGHQSWGGGHTILFTFTKGGNGRWVLIPVMATLSILLCPSDSVMPQVSEVCEWYLPGSPVCLQSSVPGSQPAVLSLLEHSSETYPYSFSVSPEESTLFHLHKIRDKVFLRSFTCPFKDILSLIEQDKLSAVLKWPHPQGLKTMQHFLGFANYYRQFILHSSSLM